MERRGISRLDLSAMSGVNASSIYLILPVNNKAYDAPISTYRTIAAALEVEFHLLIEEVEENMSRNLIETPTKLPIKPFPPLMTTAENSLVDVNFARDKEVAKPSLFERALAKLHLKKA